MNSHRPPAAFSHFFERPWSTSVVSACVARARRRSDVRTPGRCVSHSPSAPAGEGSEEIHAMVAVGGLRVCRWSCRAARRAERQVRSEIARRTRDDVYSMRVVAAPRAETSACPRSAAARLARVAPLYHGELMHPVEQGSPESSMRRGSGWQGRPGVSRGARAARATSSRRPGPRHGCGTICRRY